MYFDQTWSLLFSRTDREIIRNTNTAAGMVSEISQSRAASHREEKRGARVISGLPRSGRGYRELKKRQRKP
jgi:hypothetical protein